MIGSTVYAKNNRPGKGKFEPRSKKCVLVEYNEECKAYLLWRPGTHIILKSTDVQIIENRMSQNNENQPDIISELIENKDKEVQMDKEYVEFELQNTQMPQPPNESSDSSDEEKGAEAEPSSINPKRLRGRPRKEFTGRPGRPRKIYRTESLNLCTEQEQSYPIPLTVNEAMELPNAKVWMKAMQNEYDFLIDNKTWELVDLPKGKKPVKCKWVFTT